MAAFGLAVGMLLVATSTSFAATAAPQQLNYLWSIPSASGSLTGRDNQHLVLRLVGVRDYLTRFTDRPVSQAYVVANADFVRRFKRYFATANPNAVLSFSKAGEDPDADCAPDQSPAVASEDLDLDVPCGADCEARRRPA